MAFVDDLGFVVAIILAAAVVFAYASIKGLLAVYRNDPKGLRTTLKSSAVPVGILGGVQGLLGLGVEILWPFPGSYNIFFGDAMMMFAMVMLVYALVAWFGLKLEYVGIFGAISGVVVAWYGYWGYTTLVKPGSWRSDQGPARDSPLVPGLRGRVLLRFPRHPGRRLVPRPPRTHVDALQLRAPTVRDFGERAAEGRHLEGPYVLLGAHRVVPDLRDPGGHRGVALYRRHPARTPDERPVRRAMG